MDGFALLWLHPWNGLPRGNPFGSHPARPGIVPHMVRSRCVGFVSRRAATLSLHLWNRGCQLRISPAASERLHGAVGGRGPWHTFTPVLLYSLVYPPVDADILAWTSLPRPLSPPHWLAYRSDHMTWTVRNVLLVSCADHRVSCVRVFVHHCLTRCGRNMRRDTTIWRQRGNPQSGQFVVNLPKYTCILLSNIR